MDYKSLFIFDGLSQLIAAFIALFSILVFIYSLGYIKEKKAQYYTWFFVTSLVSLGVSFANNLLLFVVLWGFLGLALFRLISINSSKESSDAAKKALIMVGGSDGFLLLGFLIYGYMTLQTPFHAQLVNKGLITNSSLSLFAFLCIVVGCFAKAGGMPFHTWIPDTAQHAPLPVVAYLPASLDKLLGIYLLARIAKDTFILDNRAKMILLILGALTIVFAVLMALIQHNMRRLLGYHAVSQVGYMVLGIACATPLGIAAGLFHMINHALYKSCLFLDSGNVYAQCRSDELDELGGLAKFMPITFITMLIASFSISGIPPFNGFVSKWLIYQSLIEFSGSVTSFPLKCAAIFSLIAALIGSGLTLASFLKLISSVFFGNAKKVYKEVGPKLLIAPILLSSLCIVFGIFAYSSILAYLHTILDFNVSGLWQPSLANLVIIVSLLIGLLIYSFNKKTTRTSPTFIGGEVLADDEELKISDFYNTIKEMPLLRSLLPRAQAHFFDIYDVSIKCLKGPIAFLRYLHNGVLPTYLAWCLIGAIGLFFIFFK